MMMAKSIRWRLDRYASECTVWPAMARSRDNKEGEGLDPAYAANYGISGDNQSWLLTDLAELEVRFQLGKLAAWLLLKRFREPKSIRNMNCSQLGQHAINLLTALRCQSEDWSAALRRHQLDLLFQLWADCTSWHESSLYSQIATIIVAVVRPWRLNHTSEYLGPSTW